MNKPVREEYIVTLIFKDHVEFKKAFDLQHAQEIYSGTPDVKFARVSGVPSRRKHKEPRFPKYEKKEKQDDSKQTNSL